MKKSVTFRRGIEITVVVFLLVVAAVVPAAADETSQQELITLRCWGVPIAAMGVESLAKLKILDAFQKKFPYIRPVSDKGLEIPVSTGIGTMDIVPLMQIAGDIPADVMYVNFRMSETYIRNKFLYPLDKYIEGMLGLNIKNGPYLSNDEYLKELKKSPRYDVEMKLRVPEQCWRVIRRVCPYGEDCPYCREWGIKPARKHYHVWAFPQGPLIIVLFYRKDLFREAGLPDRPPETMEELLEWAKKLTNPPEQRYGLQLSRTSLGFSTVSFLYSMGGLLVDQNEEGQWRCVFDSPAAVDAYYYVARLFHEPFTGPNGKTFYSVAGGEVRGGFIKNAMAFWPIDQRFFDQYDPAIWGFGPVPKGSPIPGYPEGKRGSSFNSRMTGIFAGLENNKKKRDAAWKYIQFYDGPEARIIRAKTYVEHGLAKYVQAKQLIAAGYPEYVQQIPKGWTDAYEKTLKDGVPEPYGKNCQMVFQYLSRSVDQIITDKRVKKAVIAGDEERAKKLIAKILKDGVTRSNEKMLDIYTPDQLKKRTTVASIVAVAIFVIFVLVFRKVFKAFDAAQIKDPNAPKGKWQFGRFKWAYIILIPAVGSILLWRYYPLAKGTVMAFQNYNVRGFSEWTGMKNFANVLYNAEFWHSMWVSLKYAILFGLFGFTAPIALAFLLTEVPRGKVLYRTIYYMPAVLTGLLVMYLWRGFYGQFGMINHVINIFVNLLNHIPGVALEEIHQNWLQNPRMAIFCILLPVIWVSMGPGCLIYLAALKTVPEEIYEAADIDGAGIMQKVIHVAIPNIKGLIMINFIGVMVATVKGGGQFALAMTGGGPHTPYGQTEFIGLHIYWQAFGYLNFGAATAMAWILGSMLVGFTVVQLQRLSRMEFRTAGGVGK